MESRIVNLKSGASVVLEWARDIKISMASVTGNVPSHVVVTPEDFADLAGAFADVAGLVSERIERLKPFQRFGEWAEVFAELAEKGWRVPGCTAFRDRPNMEKDEIYLSGKESRIVMRGVQGNLVVTISDGATLADFWPTLARLESMRDAALKAGEAK